MALRNPIIFNNIIEAANAIRHIYSFECLKLGPLGYDFYFHDPHSLLLHTKNDQPYNMTGNIQKPHIQKWPSAN